MTTLKKLFCKAEQINEARIGIMGTWYCNFLIFGLYTAFNIDENNAVVRGKITLKERWWGTMSWRRRAGIRSKSGGSGPR